MRILLTADPELPVPPKLYGGIERIVDLLLSELQRRGHTVGLVAHRDSTALSDYHFPWPGRSSLNKLDTLHNTHALWKAVKCFQPDIIHSFSRVLYLLPLLRTPIPKVMSYQRLPTSRTVQWSSRLAGQSLTFTGCSDYICQRGLLSGGTWHPIHNCVELDKYTFQAVVKPDAPLVFLSRLEQIKGVHAAIEVAHQTGRQLLIAGNRVDTEEGRAYWDQEIVPYLGERIKYIGPVDDERKNKLLGQAIAMIVPIEWDEPFGIVFAEALACGTPVVSSPRGALPEIIRHGIDGYLVNDIEEACQAVRGIHQVQRDSCRQRAEQFFSASVIVDKYEHLYKSLALYSSSRLNEVQREG
jgi:glycosyltransferase involved in cell wall biosynthesis